MTDLLAKKPKLTKKQRGFVKDYLKTGNATEAARNNYNVTTDGSARAVGSETLALPNVKSTIAELLSDDDLARVHQEGLAATAVRFTPEGEQIEVPDYSTRHKYLDSGYKIKKLYGSETPDAPRVVNYNFINMPKVQEKVRTFEEQIKAELEAHE